MPGKMELKDIILYWLTACEDLQREQGGCRNCYLEKECLMARYQLFGKDVLKDKKYKLSK